MTGPITLDRTGLGDIDQEPLRTHLRSPQFMWVTAKAWSPDGHWDGWTQLGGFISPTLNSAHVRLELPDPAPGARGHLTINDTRHDLVCVGTKDDTPDAPWSTITRYRHLDPAWVHDLPAHTRRLLHALRHRRATPLPPPPTRSRQLLYRIAPFARSRPEEPRGLMSFTTPELVRTLGPLLDVPAYMADTLTAAASAYPDNQPLDLAELIDITHAL